MPDNEILDCQAKACSLQTCLGKNTYSPEKCDDRVFALYQCCLQLYQVRADGDPVNTTSCPQQSVIKRWMQKHHNGP
ncbi:hypothetical protein M408DRAFT_328059 [Serendipita vermifera MAFF 305830]|uniref:Cx9C motif-containing protein 4, mitochondrial n=1 Tax=Serendipita vermifera MAFF 305830 TaxID=933852 RepID=A0A0C3BG69_SERVB|nr:hypothetical protein M408DRAFT_328059 [Serendipita vermifera MAFF 305830]